MLSLSQIKDGLVEAGLLVANEGGQQQEEVGYLQLLHHLKDQIGPQMRLDLVEFELRHLKEHVDKLKFNFVEMSTKQQFMSRLMDADEWGHLFNGAIWTAADIKALERQSEPTKTALVDAKGRTGDAESELSRITEHLSSLSEIVSQRLTTACELEEEIGSLEAEIGRMRPDGSEDGGARESVRSVEELQEIVDEQIIGMEKGRQAVEERRAAVRKLAEKLASQQAEVEELAQVDAGMLDKVRQKEESEAEGRQYTEQLNSLAEWYRAALNLHTSLTGISSIEMVRPDYLLLTLTLSPTTPPEPSSPLPVHLRVCPATGRLQAAQIGATSSTPRRGQWKEIVGAAVDGNNISHLVRQIHSALVVASKQ